MTKKVICLSLGEGLLSLVDAKRGLIPRSRFVEKIIADSVMGENGN